MIISDHNNSCWGTNVPWHRRVWAQIKCVWAQSCLGTVVWAQSCMGTNVVEPCGVCIGIVSIQ